MSRSSSLDDRKHRILYSALKMFISHGIKRTSVDEIAMETGMTRITVYRYFENKEALVRAVFVSIVKVFEDSEKNIGKNKSLEDILDGIHHGLSALPEGNLCVLMNELNIIYPNIFEEVYGRRLTAITKIFTSCFSDQKQISQFRSDLNPDVLRAFVEYFIFNIINNTTFTSLGLSQNEIFKNIKTIILHGILNPKISVGMSRGE